MRKRLKRNQRPRANQRKQNDSYIICGRNAVLDGIKGGRAITVYISNNIKDNPKIDEIVASARKAKAQVLFTNKDEVDKISKDGRNQGVVAICKKPAKLEFADFLDKVNDRENVCLVMLTEIEYEQNMGAILRTIDASGTDGVVVSSRIKNADSSTVRRISMGASESTNVFTQNIFIAIRMLKERGFKIIGIESTGDKHYINADFSGRIALVFGGEDKSLSGPITEDCDEVVSIPMLGNVTSLNVSVSVGVIVYERLRQVVNKSIYK